MDVSVVQGDAAALTADVWFVPMFDGDLKADKRPRALGKLDGALFDVLRRAADQESFSGKPEQSFALHTHRKTAQDRVVLLGLGSRERFRPEVLRQAFGRAAKLCHKLKAKRALFSLPERGDPGALARAATEGLLLGGYRFDRYRTTQKDDREGRGLNEALLLLPGGAKPSKDVQNAVALGREVGLATNWARDLVNEPAGTMTPKRLADEAQALAKAHGLVFWVGGLKDIRALKMGMFLGVAQGSAEEPKLVRVSYEPKQAQAKKRPALALVGKAITFDSGGLSLKTAEGMVDMKTDMAGSAAVLATMRVVAHLAPPFPVYAYMGACENMPSGTAYRPGDILISRLGKTVEINNTDAEGRLVLGDVLAWANEQKPAALIDVATLTGACMVALGHYTVGAFSPDDAFANEVLDAARSSGELFWRMPMEELLRDNLRSEVADMKNTGERWGGAISAALFLREFVGETPWVHLDIAGPSQSPKERGYHIKGATGIPVRTLVELVRARAKKGGGKRAR